MSEDRLAIALAQLDPVVGDVDGNLQRLRDARAQATEEGADVLIATELVIAGYPPEDLVRRASFLDRVEDAVRALAADTGDGGPAVVLGAPWREDPETRKRADDGRLYNVALVLDGGEVKAVRAKWDLPNYGVFDEKRLFTPGALPGPVQVRGVRLGLMVCEDMWTPDVAESLQENGAQILVAINGSPFDTGKPDIRLQLALARVSECELPLIYLNQVGGQDELVFDGASFALDSGRNLVAQLPAFREMLAVTTWQPDGEGDWTATDGPRVAPPEGPEAVYRALVLGLRDYVRKNGFPGAVVGLSGGIDSALTAAVAADALGPDQLRCVLMPSPYTRASSSEDAEEVARLLGARLDTLGIEPAMTAVQDMMAPVFDDLPADTTEENIQSRLRGLTLMAISNKFGPMVLATGNKSELAVGYATLYGDMCGGYNVLKDVYKTQVYELARWRNQQAPEDGLGPAGRVMPERVLEKAPSAELKPDQTDQDSLPPYGELDAILEGLVEDDQGVETVAARGHDAGLVREVQRRLEGAEYKRRQGAPGAKVSRRQFGRDRRYPMTNGFRG
ncbi:NH(3)-dependent NAD(+) synthetase [Limimonas halophila]|uniref:Glutamine-dependent NAD(+) synthetase n=1 Tax=Limimonas halophila TaxID=1082479 RepID=A0A1G7QSJ8_9PROT|nr:NAD+ synthase [Limimonas halophila]SDG01487.1 NH(3)-dependent NAD(+) synthetase [Limimonas halophila]